MPTTTEIKLDGEEFILLQSLLKLSSMAETGGEAKAAIVEGKVKVDGITETHRGKKIRAGQTVFYKGHIIKVV